MGESFLSDIPGEHVQVHPTDPLLAGDATEEQVVFVAPFACVYTGTTVTPDANVTGNTAAHKNLNVKVGGGAEIANLDLDTGTDLTAATETVVGSGLSQALAKGASITIEFEQVGAGVAIPRSLFKSTFRPQ